MRRAIFCCLLSLFLLSVAPAQQGPEHRPEETHAEGKDMTMWKWANFAILAGALGFLIAKNAGPFFAARSAEIRKGMTDAQKLRADAEAQAAAMDLRLAGLGNEIEALRRNSKDEVAQEAERIRQETEREIAKVQANADHEIASALKAAQGDLKNYSAQLAVELARKKIEDRMTVADQDRLVQGFIADLGATQ